MIILNRCLNKFDMFTDAMMDMHFQCQIIARFEQFSVSSLIENISSQALIIIIIIIITVMNDNDNNIDISMLL